MSVQIKTKSRGRDRDKRADCQVEQREFIYNGEFRKKKQGHRSLNAAGVEDTSRETVGLQQ